MTLFSSGLYQDAPFLFTYGTYNLPFFQYLPSILNHVLATFVLFGSGTSIRIDKKWIPNFGEEALFGETGIAVEYSFFIFLGVRILVCVLPIGM